MSLYKYLTFKSLQKVLAGSIRFTQPGAFNDPFEMIPELHVPEHLHDENINIHFDVLKKRREPLVGELPSTFSSVHCNDGPSRDILSSLNKNIGVLCLSKNSDSLLMWSHYAEEYSGAVIEFDETHEFFKGQIEIDYREKRPIKDIGAYVLEGSAVPIAELCVKPKQWEYEEEVRIIRCLSDCSLACEAEPFPIYTMGLPFSCIKSITMGERMSVDRQREIFESIKDTDISLSLAAIDNWGYKFRKEIIKLNEPLSKIGPTMSPRTAHVFKEYPGELGELARWMIEKHPLSEFVNRIV